jgi:hypothetical protein
VSKYRKGRGVKSKGLDRPDQPPSVLEKCRLIFSGLLGDVYGLGFNENPLAGGETEYLLTGTPLSSGTARGQYPVLPLMRTENNTFWIGASLRFSTELHSKRLTSVSLLFFEGSATDSEKRPLLRAEWDSWESSHAQPHWHVYPPLLSSDPQHAYGFGGGNLSPKEFGATSPFEREGLRISAGKSLSIDRFHYAMSTLWHSQGPNSHWSELSEEYLLKWLQGCVIYTQGQLKYISS